MKNKFAFIGIIVMVAVIVIGFTGCGELPDYPTEIPIEWRGTWRNTSGNDYTLYLTATTARVTGTGSQGDANGITYNLNVTEGYHNVHGFFFGSDYNSGVNRNMINLGRIDPKSPYVGVAGFGTRLGASTYSRISGTWSKQ